MYIYIYSTSMWAASTHYQWKWIQSHRWECGEWVMVSGVLGATQQLVYVSNFSMGSYPWRCSVNLQAFQRKTILFSSNVFCRGLTSTEQVQIRVALQRCGHTACRDCTLTEHFIQSLYWNICVYKINVIISFWYDYTMLVLDMIWYDICNTMHVFKIY